MCLLNHRSMRIPFHSSLRCTSNRIRGFTVLTSSTKTLRKVTDTDLHKNGGHRRSTVERHFSITDNSLLLNSNSSNNNRCDNTKICTMQTIEVRWKCQCPQTILVNFNSNNNNTSNNLCHNRQ